MEAVISNDYEYLVGILSKPGIWRACSMGMDWCGPEDVVRLANGVFIEARDGERRCGFSFFHEINDGVWQVHNCLLTLGSRTVQAIQNALDLHERDTKPRAIITFCDTGHRAANEMAKKFAAYYDTFKVGNLTINTYLRLCQSQ